MMWQQLWLSHPLCLGDALHLAKVRPAVLDLVLGRLVQLWKVLLRRRWQDCTVQLHARQAA
jgi:hypothetical protein